jgi:hypothetical protein
MGIAQEDRMSADNAIRFDMSGWEHKSAEIQRALAEAIKKAVDFGMDEVNKEAAKNLSGPSYGVGGRGPMTGQVPIPRQTANLADSLDSKRPSSSLGYVYSRSDKANYNKAVHDGYKPFTDKKGRKHPGARPRRFLGDAVKMRKEAVMNRMRYLTILAIRKAGQ